MSHTSRLNRPQVFGSKLSRRDFVLTSSLATASLISGSLNAAPPNSFKGTLCFFSKHLPDMEPHRLAESVKGIGFTGIDLTVRKRGHVLPERAAEDLPKAVEAILRAGLEVPMITTELLSASDPTARAIL
ncbi:MAG TPA: sugar phosphate isomerase/epimerase, partial [Acidobacteriota bacterium]|nr:sugar phosphate isomerase/epimerase [Acidobacteriota bacterium]